MDIGTTAAAPSIQNAVPPACPAKSTRTGMSNPMRVSLSPTSTTFRTSRLTSLTPSAAATRPAVGRMSDTRSSSRPSAGTGEAVTPGGNDTSANAATMETAASAGKVAARPMSPGAPPSARPDTLIAGRTESPPSTTLTVRTKLSGPIATTGARPAGAAVRPCAPDPTEIASSVNTCRTPSTSPSRSVLSAIAPVSSAATPSPPNRTVCTAVPRPDTPPASGSAAAPPAVVTAPYTGPLWSSGGPSGALYAMRTVFGPVNAAVAAAVASGCRVPSTRRSDVPASKPAPPL